MCIPLAVEGVDCKCKRNDLFRKGEPHEIKELEEPGGKRYNIHATEYVAYI
jgi:hypothetical protein